MIKSVGVVMEHRRSEVIGQVAFLLHLLTTATRHMGQPAFSCQHNSQLIPRAEWLINDFEQAW